MPHGSVSASRTERRCANMQRQRSNQVGSALSADTAAPWTPTSSLPSLVIVCDAKHRGPARSVRHCCWSDGGGRTCQEPLISPFSHLANSARSGVLCQMPSGSDKTYGIDRSEFVRHQWYGNPGTALSKGRLMAQP